MSLLPVMYPGMIVPVPSSERSPASLLAPGRHCRTAPRLQRATGKTMQASPDSTGEGDLAVLTTRMCGQSVWPEEPSTAREDTCRDRRSRDRALDWVGRINGAPVGIRTPNLLIRSQMLYPVELRVRRVFQRRFRRGARIVDDGVAVCKPLGNEVWEAKRGQITHWAAKRAGRWASAVWVTLIWALVAPATRSSSSMCPAWRRQKVSREVM